MSVLDLCIQHIGYCGLLVLVISWPKLVLFKKEKHRNPYPIFRRNYALLLMVSVFEYRACGRLSLY
jgi:hypothetical protein